VFVPKHIGIGLPGTNILAYYENRKLRP